MSMNLNAPHNTPESVSPVTYENNDSSDSDENIRLITR